MDFFQQSKDLTSAQQEIDGQQKYLDRLNTEKDVLTEDLKAYETEGYEAFKKVLAKEKIRIALVRMTVAAEENVLHNRLQGQFNECELLERNREKIRQDLSVTERKISESVAKINKLKKQFEKQIRK